MLPGTWRLLQARAPGQSNGSAMNRKLQPQASLIRQKASTTFQTALTKHARSFWMESMAARRTGQPVAVGVKKRNPEAASGESDAEKLRFIEEMTRNVDAVQERVLAEILGRNADAEYLASKCGLAGATDRATFRSKVPMVEYEDLRPYIRRIADGDRSPILSGSGNPISEFLVSSGTSGGEPKLMPVVEDELDRRQLMYSLITAVMNQYVAGLDKGNSGLYFLFVRSGTTTPSGLPVRAVLTSYYKSDQLKDDTYHQSCTSPMEAILCEDVFQSMYAQMVCGLCQRHGVLRVGTVFATGLVRAIQFFQQHWEQLAADIEAGELNPCVVSDPSVREAVAGVLRRPDPELAEFVRAECSHGDWAGIITRIWPNAKYLDTIATGSMAQYVPTLNYYSGGLPIASVIYGSSECYLGLNLRPMCDPSEVSYTIMPNMAYLEFLPTDTDGDSAEAGQLVELASVEAGREYELVVTNYSGLCRYRLGDVLRVAGFHNAAPRFQFVRRTNMVLSVDAENTDEADLQRAVERASSALLRPHGAAVLDYTSRVCTESIPGHYVVYWELQMLTKGGEEHAMVDKETLDGCCLEMEEAMNFMYRKFRVADCSIGPLEIRVVRPGTFQEVADHAISRGASVGQYKVPRCVRAPEMIQLLESHVASRHSSQALPDWGWAPGQHFGSTSTQE